MRTTINGIDCFGEMYKEQNVSVTCDDEIFDGIYPEGFETWEDQTA